MLPSYFPRKYPEQEFDLHGGTYCVSATMLQAVYFRFDPFRHRWGAYQERAYREVLRARRQLAEAGGDPAKVRQILGRLELSTPDDFRRLYEESRFARLCAALRQREPNAQVGYSILIYELSDDEVQRAIFGGEPPWEIPPAGRE
jgi:hypothetical protein